MASQAVRFDGLPKNTDVSEWKRQLECFGNVQFLYFSSAHDSGYAIFSNQKAALNAVEELYEAKWPQGSDNVISFQLCSIDEVDNVVQLTNQKFHSVEVSKPETGATLFRQTKTQPPVFWRTKL